MQQYLYMYNKPNELLYNDSVLEILFYSIELLTRVLDFYYLI